jgi:hypothetical protein
MFGGGGGYGDGDHNNLMSPPAQQQFIRVQSQDQLQHALGQQQQQPFGMTSAASSVSSSMGRHMNMMSVASFNSIQDGGCSDNDRDGDRIGDERGAKRRSSSPCQNMNVGSAPAAPQ